MYSTMALNGFVFFLLLLLLIICLARLIHELKKKNKKDKLGKEQIVSIITCIITAIATILSSSSAIEVYIGSNVTNAPEDVSVIEYVGNNYGVILNGDNNVVSNVINSDPQQSKLQLGKIFFEAKNYDAAFEIFSSEILKNNAEAQINIAYMYAHGYGVEEDVSKALEIYEQINTDDAKRNKLGLLIASNNHGNNNEEIIELINFFIGKDDYCVWNFLSLSKYEKSIDEMCQENPDFKQSFTCELSDLYVWEYERKQFFSHPKSTAYTHYEYVSVNPGNMGDYINYIVYSYNEYRLKYIGIIDKIVY